MKRQMNNNAAFIIGYLLRKERLNQNMSLRYFADCVGISAQYLNEIEHGLAHESDYVLKKLQSELIISINTEINVPYQLQSILNQMYIAYVNNKEKLVIDLYKRTNQNAELYSHSLGYPYFLLITLIYLINIDESTDYIYSTIDELLEFENILDNCNKLRFYDIVGYYYLKRNFNNKAYLYLTKANLIQSNNLSFEYAILNLHLCLYYIELSDYLNALEYCEKANVCFSNLFAVNKHYEIFNIRIKLYLILRNYSKAKDCCNIILNSLNKSWRNDTLSLLAICYIYEAKYEKALNIYNIDIGLDNISSFDIFNISYIYYKQMNYEKNLDYIKEKLDISELSYPYNFFIDVFQSILMRNKYEIDNKIDKFFTIALSYSNDLLLINSIRFILPVIIDFYTIHGNYKIITRLYEIANIINL